MFFPSSLFSLIVNGGYNHCNSISEKNNTMDVEMTNNVGPVCRQNLLIHSGNSLTRDHPLPCERLLHVSQLNLSRSDTRYFFSVLIAMSVLSLFKLVALLNIRLWSIYYKLFLFSDLVLAIDATF